MRNNSQAPSDRPRLRDRQGPARLSTGEWEVGRIYETRGGAVSEELARLEGVGQVEELP